MSASIFLSTLVFVAVDEFVEHRGKVGHMSYVNKTSFKQFIKRFPVTSAYGAMDKLVSDLKEEMDPDEIVVKERVNNAVARARKRL